MVACSAGGSRGRVSSHRRWRWLQGWAPGGGPMPTGEFLGVAAIGLHPIAGFRRHERRGHDVTGDPKRGELPVEDVAAGAGFVAGPELLAAPELADQLGD